MNIKINGKLLEFEKELTIGELLKTKNINPLSVIVELNYEIPEKDKWDTITLKDGDNIEMVKFIGGG